MGGGNMSDRIPQSGATPSPESLSGLIWHMFLVCRE
jgi:hypothetical protein